HPSAAGPASSPSEPPGTYGGGCTMTARHYGHLAPDGREHAIRLLAALDQREHERCQGERQQRRARSVDPRAPVRPGLGDEGRSEGERGGSDRDGDQKDPAPAEPE